MTGTPDFPGVPLRPALVFLSAHFVRSCSDPYPPRAPHGASKNVAAIRCQVRHKEVSTMYREAILGDFGFHDMDVGSTITWEDGAPRRLYCGRGVPNPEGASWISGPFGGLGCSFWTGIGRDASERV